MLDAFAGAQMKASPPLLFAILPTIGAIICFVSASVGGDPVETYVSFDVVKKFVTFAFTVYNIQARHICSQLLELRASALNPLARSPKRRSIESPPAVLLLPCLPDRSQLWRHGDAR